MKIILLNGPPGSGKTTLANLVAHELHDQLLKSRRADFADALRAMACRLYEIDATTQLRLERHKDEPDSALFGRTWRQVLIAVSEDLVKPLHGKGFFGRAMVQRLDELEQEGTDVVVVGDSGFAAEAAPLIDRWPVLRIAVHRAGTHFGGDSRGFWTLGDALGVAEHPTYSFARVDNDAAPADAAAKIIQAYAEIRWVS